MSLYYINHRNSDGVSPPMDGEGYADIETAREECLVSAKQLISEWLAGGQPLSEMLHQSFEVANEGGDTVLTVPFSDALEADTRNEPVAANWPSGGHSS